MMKLLSRLILVLLLFVVADFLYFRCVTIPHRSEQSSENLEYLVVLTGGAERIEAGLVVAENPKVKKILISGVHPDVTRAEILARRADLSATVGQKIELDYVAQTTRQNAQQTLAWAKKNNVAHIGLLTADYHTPRAKMLFSMYAPSLKLTLLPVPRPQTSLHFYVREYLKYFGVRAEMWMI